MKRARMRWATLAVAVAGWTAACGVEGGRTFLSLGTGGTGGIYYPLGGALASRLSIADESRQYTAEVSGGSVENINRLAAGQIDLAFALGVTAFQAQTGLGDWEQPVSGLRVLAPLYPNLTHVLVPAGSEAIGIADLVGQRVSVGSPGSGTEQVARHMLDAYGISYEDIDVRYLSFNESSSALRDGAIDAAVMSVGFPAAAVLEVTTTAGVRLLPIDPEVVSTMQEQHPYYTTTMLPELAYPGVDVAIPMLTVHNWMLGMDSLDDEVVTILLNILADDRVSLEQVHVMAEQIDLDRLSDAPIPLHSATQSWTSNR